jgi:hypothetical protein
MTAYDYNILYGSIANERGFECYALLLQCDAAPKEIRSFLARVEHGKKLSWSVPDDDELEDVDFHDVPPSLLSDPALAEAFRNSSHIITDADDLVAAIKRTLGTTLAMFDDTATVEAGSTTGPMITVQISTSLAASAGRSRPGRSSNKGPKRPRPSRKGMKQIEKWI